MAAHGRLDQFQQVLSLGEHDLDASGVKSCRRSTRRR